MRRLTVQADASDVDNNSGSCCPRQHSLVGQDAACRAPPGRFNLNIYNPVFKLTYRSRLGLPIVAPRLPTPNARCKFTAAATAPTSTPF